MGEMLVGAVVSDGVALSHRWHCGTAPCG